MPHMPRLCLMFTDHPKANSRIEPFDDFSIVYIDYTNVNMKSADKNGRLDCAGIEDIIVPITIPRKTNQAAGVPCPFAAGAKK